MGGGQDLWIHWARARSAQKIFAIMEQRYSFHFRIFENKGGKKFFFQMKSKKKKKVLDFITRGFPCGDFSLYGSPQLGRQSGFFEQKN